MSLSSVSSSDPCCFLSFAPPLRRPRGAVCVARGHAGAPAEARRQDGPQMPEQEQHRSAGGEADAEPHHQAGLGLPA